MNTKDGKSVFWGRPNNILLQKITKTSAMVSYIGVCNCGKSSNHYSFSYTRALFTKGARIGLLQDFGWWAYQFLQYPATFYVFMWLPEGVNNAFKGLLKNKVITLDLSNQSELRWKAFIHRFYKSYSNWIWIVIVIDLNRYFSRSVVDTSTAYINTWQRTSTFSFWYTIFVWTVIFLVGLLTVVRGIITIVWLNRLFHEFNIVVKILHPDGAGGLSPLGKFSVNIG